MTLSLLSLAFFSFSTCKTCLTWACQLWSGWWNASLKSRRLKTCVVPLADLPWLASSRWVGSFSWWNLISDSHKSINSPDVYCRRMPNPHCQRDWLGNKLFVHVHVKLSAFVKSSINLQDWIVSLYALCSSGFTLLSGDEGNFSRCVARCFLSSDVMIFNLCTIEGCS